MSELIDAQEFFAPMASDFVDSLVGQYRSERMVIESLASVLSKAENLGAVNYFLNGNRDSVTHSTSFIVSKMFLLDGAIAALNASYWQRALSLTDVYDYMPQARRDEWYSQIEKMTTPNFEDSTVRSTLEHLLSMRSRFLAERVDGIFRNLSGDHVTNQPQGFSKRMIIAGVIDSFSFSSSSRCGYINDLRAVIAKFMGRDEPRHDSSQTVVRAALRKSGEWVSLDGGAIRLRVYLKGTAHLEIHPDMAWRLNMILASLYPMAIPATFRTKPAKKAKEYNIFNRVLPFAVVNLLGSMEQAYSIDNKGHRPVHTKIPNALQARYWGSPNKFVTDEVDRVLTSIGGTRVLGYWQFDYDPSSVIDEIVCSGCIPDQKAHQFYPTPVGLAKLVSDFADAGDLDRILEPSAGTGGLADFLPKKNLTCIEISQLNCTVLESKGYPAVVCADFLSVAPCLYERVVMNPPFSEGRWLAHLSKGLEMVAKGGRLVAILPSSAKNKQFGGGDFDCEWHGPFENEFIGTTVSVVVLVAIKK